MRWTCGLISGAAVCASAWGCGGAPAAQQLVKAPEFNPESQTKCAVKKSQERPLIVEWPAADRGALEAQSRRGIVAVRYDGCEMEILRHCAVPGAYDYTPVTPKQDRIRMSTADELHANIPVYAAKFEAKLQTAGHLDVDMMVVGSFDADRRDVTRDQLDGNCRGATHYLSSLTAGAFEFTAGGSAEVGGGAEVLGAGAGAKSAAHEEVLNRDGYKKACADASNEDTQPPEGCGALLRVEVAEIGTAAVEPSAPAESPPAQPDLATGPGVIQLHMTSDEPVQLIRLGPVQAMPFGMANVDPMALRQRELVCTSPCDSWVDARQGAEFILSGEGVLETEPFQLGTHEGNLDMQVDAGSVSAYGTGLLLVWTGAPLLLFYGFIPLGVALHDPASDPDGSLRDIFVITGAVTGSIGAALLAIGIPLMVTSDTEYQIGATPDGIALRF